MTRFALRLRDSEESQLKVSIFGDLEDEIKARSGGNMTLEVVWKYAGEELLREEIFATPIDAIQIRKEPDGTYIEAEGNYEKTFPGTKEVVATGVQYAGHFEGKSRYRISFDYDLNPGDTLSQHAFSTITVEEIVITAEISPEGNIQEVVEVAEEAT